MLAEILALTAAALLQTGAPALAAAPESLVVRPASRTAVSVPVVETNTGPAIRADLAAGALGGRVRRLPNGHYAISVAGLELDVTAQVPFARVGAEVVPLIGAPFVDDGHLYVPFQLIADVLPRFGTGVLYDAAHGELRVFAPGVTTAARRPASRGDDDDDVLAAVSRAPTRAVQPAVLGAPSRLTRAHRVVVDAGHGGVDNGMQGPIGGGAGGVRIHEKDITLAVSRYLVEALRARGVDVVQTRTRDTLIALSDRGRIANQARGDLFISVHVNAANLAWKDPSAARGFETYFLAEAKTEEARRVERMENEAVRFETGADAPRGDPLSFIINDMAQNEHLREANDLAESVQRRLRGLHPGPNRGVKQANFAVLRTSFMPAVLVEIGFGTNPAEASWMADPKRQREIGAAMADAAVDYLAQYERRVRGAGK